MMKRAWALTALVLLAFGSASPVWAQANSYASEDSKRIKSAEVVGALGEDMFGEQVNFYTGSTSFQHTDLSLPGNDALPMVVSRRLDIADVKDNPFGRFFGDWELDVPYVGGLFLESQGWIVGTSQPLLRCSSPTSADLLQAAPVTYNQFTPNQYWHGYDLFVPGKGSQQLLLKVANSLPTPSSGGPYKWVTKDLWQVSCLDTLANNSGSGQGFVALAPDGTRYFLDHMVVTPARSVGRREMVYIDPSRSVATSVTEARKQIRLYATRVEDRFGNSVDYNWAGANLTSISASDGRSLTFAYNGNRIASVSDGLRIVNYAYTAEGSLSTVTYPDQSRWTLQLSSAYPVHYDGGDGSGDNWDMDSPWCGFKRIMANSSATGTLVHPSGATATFTFQFKRHIRASVPDAHCNYGTLWAPIGTPNTTVEPDEPWDFVSWTPRTFDVIAITSKQITGPGVETAQWTYSYAGGPTGPITPGGTDYDYGPLTRSVTVTEPGNTHRVFTFGNRYEINEGQLLSVDTYSGATLLKRNSSVYLGTADVASQPFPDQVGLNPNWTSDNFASERLRPLKVEELLQDDVAFTRTINTFDGLARPLSVTRASSISFANAPTSRTDVTSYYDNLTSWTLGQIKRVVNSDTGKEVVENTYNLTTALLTTSQSFGVYQPTLAYNADGTVASFTDRRTNKILFSSWYRGVPRSIAYPNGTTEAAGVNAQGWVTSVTDALGTSTGYEYDTMGRLSKLDYTDTDSVLWNDTLRNFSQSTVAVYGLPAGHWQQTITTDTGRTTTFFDMKWRPRLILTEILGDGNSKSFVVKRYDSVGREAFTSYPVGTLTSVDDPALAGTRTLYDGLGRATRVEQDSELGVLATTTEYLSGFRIRVTNPRAFPTTTSYQLFDAPSTDAPVTIMAPGGVSTVISRDVFGKPLSVTRTGPGE